MHLNKATDILLITGLNNAPNNKNEIPVSHHAILTCAFRLILKITDDIYSTNKTSNPVAMQNCGILFIFLSTYT